MKMSKNHWTAGNAMSWALGVTLGVILGIALLIAIPRTLSAPAAPESTTTSADAPQTPAAVASTGDSSGAATNTEPTAAQDNTASNSTDTTTATTTETPAGEANAEAGKAVFAGTCAGCHGTEGQGGVGPKLDITKDWSDAEFTAAVREGKAPEKELSPVMPRFAEAQLNAQQVADVHAHIKTLY